MPEATERAKSSEVGLAAKHYFVQVLLPQSLQDWSNCIVSVWYLHCFHVVPPLSSSLVFLPDRKIRTVDPKQI